MAESDKVKIEVTAEGTAETAKELDKVTESLTRQQKTQEMINKTSADIQRKTRIDALKAEAKEVNNVGAAFRTLATSSGPANDNLQKATFQMGQLRAASSASAALVGNLGRSFSVLVPQAAGFQQAIMSGGQAMSQFMGILGGGAGVAVGGVVAALALLVTWFAKSKEEADKLAEQTKKNAAELTEYLKTIGQLRQTVGERMGAAAENQEYEKKFSRGDLTSKEYAIERQVAKELYAQRNDIQKKRMAAYQAGDIENVRALTALGIKADSAPYRGEQARGFESAAREREKIAAQNKDTLAAIEEAQADADAKKEAQDAARGKNKSPWGAVSSGAVEAQLAGIAKLQEESRRREAEATARMNSAELQQSMTAAQKQYEEQKKWRDKTAMEKKKRDDEAKHREEQHHNAMMQRNKAYTDAVTNVAQIGASTSLKMFSDLAKGHKVELGAVIEGIGDQMVAEGTRVLFQAAAMAFFPPTAPFAAGLAAVGSAEIVAGIGLGAAGAHGSGGSSSGGGGSGGTGGANATNYADPYGNTQRFTDTGPTIINLTMPTVLTPTAADGERIVAAYHQAMRQRGTRI